MHTYAPALTRTLAVVVVGALFHTQLVFAAGCDLPTFGGARLFPAIGQSQALAMGDFNGDKIADLAVANAGGNVSILLGAGDGTFVPGVAVTVKGPQSIAVADFNGDGKLDLVVSDTGTFKMLFFPGNGDGTFGAAVTASSQQTGVIAVGDFNGDGKPDLALAGVPAYIMLGKGDGTFLPLIQPPSSSFVVGFGVAVGDFNGDGKLDVVVGTTGGALVLFGDGKGNMAAPISVNAGTSFLPDNLAVADVNGDHKLDLVTVTALDHKVVVLLGNGNGSFQAPITYPIGDLANGIVIADLNADGIPDLAVANHSSINAPGTISVFAGVGDGTFQPPVQYNPTVQANWALAAGDFNRDGVTDLVFTSIVQNIPAQVGVMLGNGDGTFQSPRSYAAGPLPRLPAIADFNGDGVLDMAVANAGFNGTLLVMLGNPDGSFQDAVPYPTAFGAKSVAVGDMNGDGKPDLVVANGASSNLLVFLGNGDGTFQALKPTGSFFLTTYLTLGDFNNDGKLDAAVVGVGGAQIALGNGDGTFRSTFATFSGGLCAGCGTGPIVTADLNGDGNLDLVLSNGDTDISFASGRSGTVTVLMGKGDGGFLAGIDYTVGANASNVAIGDLNGDGKPDIVATDFGGGNGLGPTGGALALLIGNGDGTFQTPVRYTAGQGASAVAIGDFDGDGAGDVAVLGRTSKTVTVYLGNGDGTLRNALVYGSGGGDPVSLAVADLNLDGKPDLLVSDQLSNSILTLMNTYIPGTSDSACTPVAALK